MKINIENMINQAAGQIKDDKAGYGYTLKELVKNLKILRSAHKKGDGDKALDSFFKTYVFNEKPKPSMDGLSWMTDNQLKIYNQLISIDGKPTNINTISSLTGVPYSSVRKTIDTFVKSGLMSKPVRHYRGKFRGFKYELMKK